ncbi:MAG: hypothetical protein QM632_03225 [Micrococcaceae bacterium]
MKRATSTAASAIGGKLAHTAWRTGTGKKGSRHAEDIKEAVGFAMLTSAAVAGLNVAFSRYLNKQEKAFTQDIKTRRSELNSELNKQLK